MDNTNNTNQSFIRKELDVQKNVVRIGKYSFKRHKNAYTKRITLSRYHKLYVELHGRATQAQATEATKHLDIKPVVQQADQVDKASQFHTTKGYIIIGKELTDTIIQRVQELLRFGHKVRLITDNCNVLYKSEYSLQSELDDVYYALDGNKNNRVKQSPFLCELQDTYNQQGAELLAQYRQQHYAFVFNYVYEMTFDLYQMKSEEARELRYERAARATYYTNYYINQYLKHPKAEVLLARLSRRAKAYGFDIQLEEGTATVDKYQPAEYIFTKKPTAFAESSETIWDTGNVDKALNTVRQKQKISELPTSRKALYEAIEAVAWMETEDLFLDPENTYRCECTYPVDLRDYRCPTCDAINPHYLVEFTTEDDAILDLRIEQMREETKDTLKVSKTKF